MTPGIAAMKYQFTTGERSIKMPLPYNPYGNLNPYTQAGLMQPQPQTNQSNII